jgi:hypothetical protein
MARITGQLEFELRDSLEWPVDVDGQVKTLVWHIVVCEV